MTNKYSNKYSNKHIDNLIDRLKQYDAWFENMAFKNRCRVCKFYCRTCLISNTKKDLTCAYDFHIKSFRIKPDLTRICMSMKCKPSIENYLWYKEMVNRANKNLKDSDSSWRIKSKYPTLKDFKKCVKKNWR